MSTSLRFGILALAAFGATQPLQAQSARSGGGASAQALQQLQQLAAERATLQDENAKLKTELDAMRKERDALKNGQQGLERRALAAEGSIARVAASERSNQEALDQQKARMLELVEKFRATVESMRGIERERDELKTNFTSATADLGKCAKSNAALYDLNTEVLNRLATRGPFNRLAEAEPFTQLKRVQLENLIDGYRNRAEDQRIAPASAPATTPSQAR